MKRKQTPKKLDVVLQLIESDEKIGDVIIRGTHEIIANVEPKVMPDGKYTLDKPSGTVEIIKKGSRIEASIYPK